MKQLGLLKNQKTDYGGSLLTTRKGRTGPRPLASRNTMHVVLRSTQAKGAWSFMRPQNRKRVQALIEKFSARYGVRVHSFTNVGNHIHLHLRLRNRNTYRAFIRALTGSIAMAITGVSRWNPAKLTRKFWDRRPFSRVGFGWRGFLTIKKYIQKNQREGLGYPQDMAERIVEAPHWVDYDSA